MAEAFKDWEAKMVKIVNEKSTWTKDEVEENLKRLESDKK